jgi:hypothetical protein
MHALHEAGISDDTHGARMPAGAGNAGVLTDGKKREITL